MSDETDSEVIQTWSLFLRSHAALVQQIEQALDRAGQVSLGWYDVLLILQRAPERRRRLSELVERSVLTKSGMSRQLDRMEAAGLLHREPCPDDRRGSYAVLSDQGFAALKSAWPVYRDAIEHSFGAVLSPDELPILAKALARLLDASKHKP